MERQQETKNARNKRKTNKQIFKEAQLMPLSFVMK
jgi:hypothetical protein